jgi:hypothetical protein
VNHRTLVCNPKLGLQIEVSNESLQSLPSRFTMVADEVNSTHFIYHIPKTGMWFFNKWVKGIALLRSKVKQERRCRRLCRRAVRLPKSKLKISPNRMRSRRQFWHKRSEMPKPVLGESCFSHSKSRSVILQNQVRQL